MSHVLQQSRSGQHSLSSHPAWLPLCLPVPHPGHLPPPDLGPRGERRHKTPINKKATCPKPTSSAVTVTHVYGGKHPTQTAPVYITNACEAPVCLTQRFSVATAAQRIFSGVTFPRGMPSSSPGLCSLHAGNSQGGQQHTSLDIAEFSCNSKSPPVKSHQVSLKEGFHG